MTETAVRPVTILIAALGGEGGGVLSTWIVDAARAMGLPVQSTSIPGVAQRTGATTYYLEIWPQTYAELQGRQPVFSLTPAPGEVDLMVATELVEAGRAISNGFVTPERTFLITSAHRVFTTGEKMAMGDGRYDPAGIRKAVQTRSRGRCVVDMAAAAKTAGSPISAVALGLMAGSGLLPFGAEPLEKAIAAEGKAVEANLAGFRRGLELSHGESPADVARAGDTLTQRKDVADLHVRVSSEFPEPAHEILNHAVGRLCDYQGVTYATLYLDRLKPFAEADGAVLAAVARELGARMSFEDVIRVAQAKTRAGRAARVRAEAGAGEEDIVTVTEFMKPGLEELCDMLPPLLARRILAWGARSPSVRDFHLAMRTTSTSVNGFLRLWLLSKARRLRPLTYRYQREQENIEHWLDLVRRAQQVSGEFAVAVAECAGLIKGYGDTHRRGMNNFQRICREIIEPALQGTTDQRRTVEVLNTARSAALDDLDGKTLDRVLTSGLGRQTPIKDAAA
jgi:indolepyruvate ferredoxin oxidoreductase beta subunit